MDPARAPFTSSTARQTLLVGAAGSAWPFVPQKLAGAFCFDYDPQRSSIIWCSGNSADVLGLSDAASSLHGAFLLAHLHPADRYRVESALSVAMQSLLPFVASYRWSRPDSNETRILHCRAMLDAESRILHGFIIDLSDQLVTLQSECDHLAAISFSFDQLGKSGVVVDAELRIRSVHGNVSNENFSLGFGAINPALVRPGALFTSIFTDASIYDQVHDLLSETLCSGFRCRVYGRWDSDLKAVAVDGIPQGIAIEIHDSSHKIELHTIQKELSALRQALLEQKQGNSKILDHTQEMVGFAALISRQATGNAILRHASEALIHTAKECAKEANGVLQHYQNHSIPGYSSPRATTARLLVGSHPARSSRRNAEVLIASSTLRSAHTLAALMRDAGLATVGTRLSEPDLKESIQLHPHTRLVVLDLSGDLQHDALLVRRLRRFFPATELVCISRESAEAFDKLRRSGAAIVLFKPATPREIERAVKQCLG